MKLIFAAFIIALVDQVLTEEPRNAKEIINKLNKCATEDRSQVDKCFTNFFIEIRPEVAAGIKEMDVPSLDALFIDRADFPENSTLIQGKAYFYNLTIKGVGNYAVKKVIVDIPKHTITLEYTAPEVEIDGEYIFDGNLQVLPIKGDGNAKVFMTDVESVLVMTVEKNETHLNLAVVDKKFIAKTIKFRLENILGGIEAGEAVNALMNENAFEVIKELLPLMYAKLGEGYKKVFDNIISQISPDIFIAP